MKNSLSTEYEYVFCVLKRLSRLSLGLHFQVSLIFKTGFCFCNGIGYMQM